MLREGVALAAEPAGADYNVKVTIRNGRLLKRIREAGYANTSAFCRAYGLKLQRVQTLVNLRVSGMNKNAEWRKSVIEVADILQCMPQDIIPEQHWHNALKHNAFELDMTGEQAAELVGSQQSPDDLMIGEEKIHLIDAALEKLTPRQERILRLRFGIGCDEHNHEQIAELFGISKTRVSQIERNALWKLKNPIRSGELRDYLHN